jgi:sRNA-binding carbon storage regulator CsrA
VLVLGRSKLQSVVVGDEITLIVEEICDSGDGQRIFGTTVRLGFQAPTYVPICRGELRAKRPYAPNMSRAAPQTQPRTGEIIDLTNAQVLLRIQVPRMVPVRHNGTPTVGLDLEERIDGEDHSSKVAHHIICHKNDQVAICNNIIIAVLGFHRSVLDEPNQ